MNIHLQRMELCGSSFLLTSTVGIQVSHSIWLAVGILLRNWDCLKTVIQNKVLFMLNSVTTTKEKGKNVKPKDLLGCGVLTQASSLVSPQPLAPSHLRDGIGERIRKAKAKARKLMGQDKDSLLSEEKNTQTHKWCRGSHSPLLTSRLMPSKSLRNSCLRRHTPPHHRHHPLPSSTTLVLLLSMVLHGTEYSCGQFGSAVSSSHLLPAPSLLIEGGVLEGVSMSRREGLDAVRSLFSITKILVCYQHSFRENLLGRLRLLKLFTKTNRSSRTGFLWPVRKLCF